MNAPIELADATWESEVALRDGPILVDFWASWCVPCRHLDPVVGEVAARYAGRLAVGKLNVDDHPRTAARHDVLSLPTLILFSGGRAVARLSGMVRARDIEGAIAPYVD